MARNKRLKLLFKYLFFLCVAFSISFVIAQNVPPLQKGKVSISGRIQLTKSSSKVISLIYSQLSANPTRMSLILDSTGHFSFDFEIFQAHDVTLRYEKGVAELYVRPMDNLYVELNSAEFQKSKYPMYLISGNNSETSRNILSYHLYNKLESFKPMPDNKSTEAYLLDIKKRILIEDSVLSAFNREHSPTKEFKTWARKDIIYRNANYLVDFEFYHSMKKTKFNGVLYDTDLFPINDPEALASSWYQYHLWQYTLFKYTQGDSLIQRYFREQKMAEAYKACLKKVIAGEKPGIGRDIMCYQLLFIISEKAHEDFRVLMKNINRYVANKDLSSVLQNRIEATKNQAKYPISFFKPGSKEEKEMIGDLWENLLLTHKGKVIYIDIWATWCGPCRSEVPFAIDLHNYYKNKPIIFANLCLASDREAWKQAIESQKIAGENYYFDKDQSELLTSKLKLAGFPTYMIIGKDGQIIDKQSPRPSSGNTIKTILTKAMER